MPEDLTLSIAVCSICSLRRPALTSLPPATPLQQSVISALSKPSVSAGLGIVYRLQGIRVEMNFGLPLVAAKTEGARKGFQLGIGMEFL